MQTSKPTTYMLRAIGTAVVVAALAACGGADDEPDTIPPGSMPADPNVPPPEPGPEPTPAPPEDPAPAPPGETMAPDDPAMQGEGDAQEVSDAQVNAFARAYLDVIEIQTSYASRVEEEGPNADLEPLQAEAEAEAQEAIERAGLSMEEFEHIGARADVDPELRARIQDAVRNVQ